MFGLSVAISQLSVCFDSCSKSRQAYLISSIIESSEDDDKGNGDDDYGDNDHDSGSSDSGNESENSENCPRNASEKDLKNDEW